MKLLYISCHSILEENELSLFTELGIECFSLGAYIKPEGHYLLPRPGIPNMKAHPELEKYAIENPHTNISKELIDWADVIMFMHDPYALNENWDKIRHKKVIFRSIGQSTPAVENMIRKARYGGLKIVRMSKMEENIVGFVESDATIPFYVNPELYKDWNGKERRVINMTQSLLGRRQFCHYDSIIQTITGFPALIYGSGNNDLGSLNGGELPFELMKGALRDSRVFVYGGTFPSPVTLSLLEAMCTGIPVVALGKNLAENVVPESDRINYYEIPSIIQNGYNGFQSDNINELRDDISKLMEDEGLAKKIGDAGRKTVIQLFGKDKIKKLWEEFLK